MKTIIITARVHDLIRANAAPGHDFKETGRKIGPDAWEVPVGDDTLDRIKSVAMPGESISDVIERATAAHRGPRQ